MTLDHAIALSLLENLSRVDLTARLAAGDPELLERALPLLSRAREIREQAAARGIHALAWNDPAMPAPLLAIADCPPALWYRGSLACLDAPAVAIVGSRGASPVSLEMATRLARDLAARGITIVSGLARGVDSAAHRGALAAGRTIAVLGSGVDRIYPAEHAGLATDIAADGLVLGEYPPGTAPLPFHFPMRNRLISGLSRAVVVIEASDKSGSLITAACALEQGREVMAVPGNALSGRNRGGHALIRDGAKIVESAEDVLEEIHGASGRSPESPAERPALPPPSDGTANGSAISRDPLLGRMTPGEPCDLDTLAASSGLAPSRLLPRLADLELAGLIRRVGGGRFLRSS